MMELQRASGGEVEATRADGKLMSYRARPITGFGEGKELPLRMRMRETEVEKLEEIKVGGRCFPIDMNERLVLDRKGHHFAQDSLDSRVVI
jgi:hypothetical protein